MNTICPKCSSNKVSGIIVDDDPKQPIIHYICEACDAEWVE